MGLNHPRDLAAWHRWQARQHPLRSVKGAVVSRARRPPLTARLFGAEEPELLVVLESFSPTSLASLVDPMTNPTAGLGDRAVAFLVPAGGEAPDSVTARPGTARVWSVADALPSSIRLVVSAGDYLPLGAAARQRSVVESTAHQVVVQHGLMTPIAPPLPADCTLLAWSDADADFWRSGRDDIATRTVGSPLLWAAGEQQNQVTDSRPTYLGQLHGAELPRRDLAAAAENFCLTHQALYRPHPGEQDRASRRQHRAWVRRGITIDRRGVALRDTTNPVVSVFSTGVLEAAARGLPAWVDFPDPPAWLLEFWERYSMHRYGGDPTPAPPRSATAPAARTAAAIKEML